MWSDYPSLTDGLAVGLPLAGFGLLVLAYLAYAVFLLRSGWLRPPRDRSAAWFLGAVLASAAWGLAGLADLASTKILFRHLAVLFDQLRYAAWVWFLLLLLRPALGHPLKSRWGAPLLALTATGLLANLYLGSVGEDSRAGLQVLVACQLGWAVLGLLLVEQVFRNQVEKSRWGAKPLCLGLGTMCLFDVYLFSHAMMFGGFDGDALDARALVHSLVTPLLLMASRRDAQWLSRVQVSKTAAFYSASLLLIGGYLLFVASAGYYVKFFGGSWGGALQVALLAAALGLLTLLVLSGTLRARLRVFLSKHFFSYRYDYRLEWLRFTGMLSSRSAPDDVGGQVLRGLADMIESRSGSLWVKTLGDAEYVQAAHWNMPLAGQPVDAQSAFCQFMREREWIIDLAAAPAAASGANTAADTAANPAANPATTTGAAATVAAPDWLLAMPEAWLVVPLLVGDDLLGFVVLGQPRTAIELDWEVRDLLKTAARQAAVFLAQMHATESLLEARKFDAFNRMSAFVVHDLKNIVTQLSLMLKNAERHKHNPEFQQDMLITVENSLDKMRQMMLQLREGERPAGHTSGVELAPMLRRIEQAARLRGRQLEIEVLDRVATRGHEERLERVIGHVVQNALDATPATGRVWVTLSQSAGRALVLVGDTGAGMSQEFVQSRLFRPFSSTKSSGMGIGAYESFQYVKELGGSIEVKSELGQGTVMSLLLPLFDLRAGSDLHAAGGG